MKAVSVSEELWKMKGAGQSPFESESRSHSHLTWNQRSIKVQDAV